MARTLFGHPDDSAVVIGLPNNFDLNEQLRCAKQVFLATAFARKSGWDIIETAMLESGASINIVTGLYCCHTEPDLLWKWLHLIPKHAGLTVHLAALTKTPKKGNAVFHPKVLIVCGGNGRFAIVGSGNLTSGGLRSNIECSIYTEDPVYIDGLLRWFEGIEAMPLDEQAIRNYQPHYNHSLAAQKVVERAQWDAEQGVKLAIIFRRRAEAIKAAKAYFESEAYGSRKTKLSTIIPSIRKLLDYDAFNFDVASWTQFYKKAHLGKIREAYLPATVKGIATIRKGLRFLFAKGQSIEERLPELLERSGNYHVRGVGLNLVSKFLAANDPKRWFVYNKQVATTLADFGYKYSGKGGTTAPYLVFVEAMRSFKDDCGAEDCVALDAFFSYWYGMYCKKNSSPPKAASTKPPMNGKANFPMGNAAQ